MCVWDPNCFKLEDYKFDKSYILLMGEFSSKFKGIILNIYGPSEDLERRNLLISLEGLLNQYNMPTCLGGDFKEILKLSDRTSCTRMDVGMKAFRSFLSSAELIDLPLISRRFTWSNLQNIKIWSRIDRFLVNSRWLHFSNCLQWDLPRLVSDHCPIFLSDEKVEWGPKPFKITIGLLKSLSKT